MRKGTKILTAVSLAVVVALGTGMSHLAGEMPGADAKGLWEYFTKTEPYTDWSFFPGRDGMYKGTHPHGARLKLYVNDVALAALKEGKPMPYGAIILKENYAKDGETLMAITPMYKVEGFNPDAGDWYWAKYKADGMVEKAGKVEGCIDCHSERKDKDWYFNEAE